MSLAPGVLGWGHVGKKVFLLIWHGPEPNKQKREQLIGRQRHSPNEIPMAMATHCWLSDYAEAWPASYSLWFKELRLMPDLLTVDSSILRRVLGTDIFRTLCKSIYTLFWEFWSEEKRKVKESKRVQVWMVAVVILNSLVKRAFPPLSLAPQPSQLSLAIHQKVSALLPRQFWNIWAYWIALPSKAPLQVVSGWGLLFLKRNQCWFDHIPIVPTDSLDPVHQLFRDNAGLLKGRGWNP